MRGRNELKKSRRKKEESSMIQKAMLQKSREGAHHAPHLTTPASAESSSMAVTRVGGTASFCSTEDIRDPTSRAQAAATCAEPHCAAQARQYNNLPSFFFPPNASILATFAYGTAAALHRGVRTVPCSVPPLAAQHRVCWAGCWVSPPRQR